MLVSKPLRDNARYDRPNNLLATPEAISRLAGRWRLLTIAILSIVWGKKRESENSCFISGDDLVTRTIPCLSNHLKFLTTRITQHGRDLYPWFDPTPLWDFWVGVERWDSDRSRDSSLEVEARYCQAFIELFRLSSAARRDHSEMANQSPANPPVVLSGPKEELIVWGTPMPPLPRAEYRVMEALVKAKAKGERLNMTQLHLRTKDDRSNMVEDPIGALKRIRKKAPLWRQVIDMADGPHGGYTLKDRPSPTRENPESHPQKPRKPRRNPHTDQS
jgi:hypothetical protein